MKQITAGIKGRAETLVDSGNIASNCDPGLPKVFSTPKLVELIECASINAIRDFYDDDELSVGVTVDITHMASTNPGSRVYAEVETAEIKGIMITFNVTAFDETKQICKGTHKRAVVKKAKFGL